MHRPRDDSWRSRSSISSLSHLRASVRKEGQGVCLAARRRELAHRRKASSALDLRRCLDIPSKRREIGDFGRTKRVIPGAT